MGKESKEDIFETIWCCDNLDLAKKLFSDYIAEVRQEWYDQWLDSCYEVYERWTP